MNNANSGHGPEELSVFLKHRMLEGMDNALENVSVALKDVLIVSKVIQNQEYEF